MGNSKWTQGAGRLVQTLLASAALAALARLGTDLDTLAWIPKPAAAIAAAVIPILQGWLGQKSFTVNPDGSPAEAPYKAPARF